ncbi:hypothetical protein B0A48_12466 [Cryoendolithus antarcticus]|uniref:DNA repair protein RAD50 n=1 Tax=Cryoendolithus antarcticus TaxID=1507870 RepID=A0A1V8SS49_9PEZI|nr:hypothetical protein B0A48_12466 [Cryoendolithus antarcticus]
MSQIDKLSILGVRSFDNTHTTTIAFSSPLTLIVGTNGSGKTTIIECLKYATAGELPPNCSKGAAWIHDPNLCHEKEVMAQVKLSFKAVDGSRNVVTRNLMLTVKKATRSVKALESNITMVRAGEKLSVSSRVADVNAMMPQYLGVSKAVLDFVVFCHQDESLWPMSTPKDLKEKFDLIFEAEKYSKAIDNIKLLKKKQGENLIKFREGEVHLKKQKESAEKSQKNQIKLSDEIEDLTNQTTDLGERIREVTRKAEGAWKLAEEASQIVGQLEGKRIEERTKEESVHSLREHMKELDKSDGELQRMFEQFEEQVGADEEEVRVQKSRWTDLNGEIGQGRNVVVAKERECGTYEAQKQRYDEQVVSRERLVKEAARTHSIRGYDLRVSDDEVRVFMERITKMARDQNAAFERARRETAEELQGAQRVLTQINESRSALNSRKESARQATAANDRRVATLQGQLNKISIDEGGKAAMETHLQDTESRLEASKAGLEGAYWEAEIKKAEKDLRVGDERKEALDLELIEGTRQTGDSARLDFVQKELKERQHALNTMQGAHGDRIAAVVGTDWQPATVDAAFQRSLEEKTTSVADAEKQRDGTARELQQLDFQLKTLHSDLQAKRRAIDSAAEKIRNAVDCEPEEYNHELNDLERNHSLAKSDADSFKVIKQYLEKCTTVATDHMACNTCMRGFKNEKERDSMLKNVRKYLAQFDASDVSQLGDLEQQLKAARDVGTDFDTWERIKEKEFPQLDKDERQLSEKRSKTDQQLEQQEEAVNEATRARRDVEAMSRTVQTIAKYHGEITGFQSQITDLVAKQKAAGLSRGLEMVQDEIKKVNEDAKAAKAQLTKLTAERDRARSNVNTLELEMRDIRSKLDNAKYQLKEKRSLETQVEDVNNANKEQRAAAKSADQEIDKLGPQLAQAQEKYDDISKRGAERDRELQAQTSRLNTSLNQLKMADEKIQAYVERDGPSQLKRGKQQVESLKAEVVRLETEQQQITRHIKKLEDTLRSHDDTKRSIADNQRYRRDRSALLAVREQIKALEATNAEADKTRATKEANHCQLERNKLAAEQASIVGQCKSKDDQLRSLIDDFESEFKSAARDYKLAHINVETTKACIEDLSRYGGALDKAIMKYHSLKMEEINRIIDELWRKTYQGTDVDTILIKSENETAGARKSYNYRVCMIKSDAEMDMRGRCSAGQKVLASIIIRLALAECFGVNCGLIALDEPTTNLDKDNIRSLAESLAEIIKGRKLQKNFQLIVITHDEDFLRYMGCSDFADTYWRVSRDDNQKSVIDKQNIAEVL